MSRILVLTTLLLKLFCTLIIVLGQESPCPEIFTYVNDTSLLEKKYGSIKIRAPSTSNELHLKVALSVPAAEPTGYKGMMQYLHTETDVALAIQQGNILWYRLYFPFEKPISLVTGIWLNGQQYCTGPSAQGEVVTSIEVEHSVAFAPLH